MNLQGATALVTGGSNGIGLAIAKTLTAAGVDVAITGRDDKRLAAAGKAIGAHPIHADVAKEADVYRSYKELFQRFDHLDILVNNAGFGVIKPLVEMDLARAGLPQNKENPTKLQGDDIAHAVKSALEMDDRGFMIELTVFATNPKD